MEKKSRSIIKAFSWRIIASLTTFLVIVFSGNFLLELEELKYFYKFSFFASFFDFFSKLILYFFHERLWQKINFGIAKKK